MKSKIYYVRDTCGCPVVTVSIGKAGRIYYRGIAICSLKDTTKKATGRDIAEGRMTKAFTNKETSEVLTPKRVRRCGNTSYFFIKTLLRQKEGVWRLPGHIKVSEYNAKPTEMEKRMLADRPRASKRGTVSKAKKPAKK